MITIEPLLLKLLPTAAQDVVGMPVNLAIVIDNSTSMHIWRQPIREAIAAACHAVDLLGPDDSISVVAFQDEARVFQPGIQAALGQIRAGARHNRSSRLLLLTDGHAEDAADCLGLAERPVQG